MFELISKIIKAKKENRLSLALKSRFKKFKKIFKYIFFDNESIFRDRIKEVMKKKHENNIISKLLKFLHNHSDRSYCMPD